MATRYTNLPGVFLDVLDGQLTAVPSPGDPIFLILGTSDVTQQTINGVTSDIDWPYTVDSTSDATTLFGSTSGLGKGLIEAASGGATNFRLWNIGPSTANIRELWQGIHEAFDVMYDQPVDYVVPYGVYLDDANVMDLNDGDATALTSANIDTLGRVLAKKVDGVWKYAWWYPDKPSDLPTSTFNGSMPQTFAVSRIIGDDLDAGGVADGSTKDDYHEVNFAYQLADFCHRGSSIVDMRLGFIGVNSPSSFTDLGVQSDWVGASPADDGSGTITVNGDGLLGNKFMAGRKAFTNSNDVTKNEAGYRAGAAGGGFFASAESSDAKRGFPNDTSLLELKDANGEFIDIGKYLSVMSSWATVGTGSGWQANAAAVYAGFASTLAPQSAPTNKSLQGMLTTLGSVAAPSFDLLAGARYVGLLNKATRAAVITDGPTAALPTSDYRRLSTMRQVEECVDGVRGVAEPFLGEGMTSAETAALDTAIGSKLKSIQDRGGISGYDYQVLMTPEQKVLGEATVQLKIIPAFELRQVTIVVGLSAS
jgi:hypothetical protein